MQHLLRSFIEKGTRERRRRRSATSVQIKISRKGRNKILHFSSTNVFPYFGDSIIYYISSFHETVEGKSLWPIVLIIFPEFIPDKTTSETREWLGWRYPLTRRGSSFLPRLLLIEGIEIGKRQQRRFHGLTRASFEARGLVYSNGEIRGNLAPITIAPLENPSRISSVACSLFFFFRIFSLPFLFEGSSRSAIERSSRKFLGNWLEKVGRM